MSTKIEFAVQMTCKSCEQAVEKCLQGVSGVEKFDINLQTGSVVVQTTLPTSEIQEILESSGRKVVIKGLAGTVAAVAMLDTGNPNIKGVVRFGQIDSNKCLIDGTIDGLRPGQHGLFIHETGDMSRGCESLGDCFDPTGSSKQRRYGDLGSVHAESDGRAAFRVVDDVIKLSDIIGRSLVVTEHPSNAGNVGKRLVCGIVARSSGLFENPKTICACDGVSIWDETSKPKAAV